MMEQHQCMVRTSVATQILKEENKALLTHCHGHSLNLNKVNF